jgi:hypothetical protein
VYSEPRRRPYHHCQAGCCCDVEAKGRGDCVLGLARDAHVLELLESDGESRLGWLREAFDRLPDVGAGDVDLCSSDIERGIRAVVCAAPHLDGSSIVITMRQDVSEHVLFTGDMT